jgi:phosphoglycolate phosphatase-like HAD superfamily hydrolase
VTALPRFEAMFFDFDGVLVESVDIKTTAFARLYAGHGEPVADAVVAYHRQNMGTSRFVKFRYIQEHILHGPSLLPDEEEALSNRFSALVVEAVVAASEVPGAEAFLQRASRQMPLFVVSGTPEQELADIVDRRGLADYFTGVHGAPDPKPVLAQGVLAAHGFRASKVLMIGDSRTDFDCARECQLRFLGRAEAMSQTDFAPGTAVIRDFEDPGLDTALRQLYEEPDAGPAN